MAEVVTVGGQEHKKRSPLGAWGLVFLTLGIYGFVWYYKINDEARRYLEDESIRPGIALLAILIGWVIIIPPYVSIYRTGQRIVRMQEKAGMDQRMSPALGLVAFLFLSLHVVYMQEQLNRLWERAAVPVGPAGG